jgi:hypothetical protein
LAQDKKQVPVFSLASVKVTGAGDCLPVLGVIFSYQIYEKLLLRTELKQISTFMLG